MIGTLDPKVPPGPLDQKWRNHRDHSRLVSPNNRRKLEIIVVGSGLAGGSAAATLGELGYRENPERFEAFEEGSGRVSFKKEKWGGEQ